jgi:hypothetical protein
MSRSAHKSAPPESADDRNREDNKAIPPSWHLSNSLIPSCPLCGAIARYFGRRGQGVWTCTAPNCGQMFERLVEPRPRGGAA